MCLVLISKRQDEAPCATLIGWPDIRLRNTKFGTFVAIQFGNR